MKNRYIIVSIIVLSALCLIAAQCGNSQLAAGDAEGTTENDAAEVQPEPTATPTTAAVESSETDIQAKEAMVTYQSIDLTNGSTLEYALVLPQNFDPAQEYPILLAFPPGGQTRNLVDVGLDLYWAEEAIERGWIVLSPVAPGGKLFFQGSEALIPELLERTAEEYRPEGGKYHLAGVRNGGLSAFRVALQHPELVHSLLALPGFPRTDEEFQQLNQLTDIPVAMFVGEEDSGWREAMQATETELSRLGGTVSLEVVEGEPHVIRSLEGEELFDILDSYRAG